MRSIPDAGHTVLIVEDDDDSRTLLGHLLAAEGYEVAMARNGLEALAAVHTCHPAVILLDVQMPVMDGVSFRRRQLKDPEIAGIPVVCVSALESAVMDAPEMRAVELVRKPIDVDRLMRVVNRITSRRAAAHVIARLRAEGPVLARPL